MGRRVLSGDLLESRVGVGSEGAVGAECAADDSGSFAVAGWRCVGFEAYGADGGLFVSVGF